MHQSSSDDGERVPIGDFAGDALRLLSLGVFCRLFADAEVMAQAAKDVRTKTDSELRALVVRFMRAALAVPPLRPGPDRMNRFCRDIEALSDDEVSVVFVDSQATEQLRSQAFEKVMGGMMSAGELRRQLVEARDGAEELILKVRRPLG